MTQTTPSVVARTASITTAAIASLTLLAAMAIWKGADPEKILLLVGSIISTLVGVRVGGSLALADPKETRR